MGNADLIQNYCNDPIFSNRSDLPPTLKITPNLQECSGSLLEMEKLTLVGPNPASLKAPYKLCAKSFNNNNKILDKRTGMPWWTILQLKAQDTPRWRSRYKPPVTKRCGDPQWWIFQGAIAVNSFVCVLNPEVSRECSFSGSRETVFHAFMTVQDWNLSLRCWKVDFICLMKTFLRMFLF